MKALIFRFIPCCLCLFMLFTFPILNPKAATYVTSGKITKDWTCGQMYSGGFQTMDGEKVFCVEPHIIYKINQTYEVTTARPSYISAQKARKLGLIAYYGSKYYQTDRHHAAAQSLIWVELGESVESSTFKVDGSPVTKEMNEIMALVNTHDTKPSFSNQTYQLKVGQSIEIKDTNQVLDRFEIEPVNGLQITKKENTLVIKALSNAPDNATIEVNNYGDSQDGTTLYYQIPGTTEGNGYQICGRFYIEDPVYSSFNIQVDRYESPVLSTIQTSKEADDEGTITFKKIDAITKQPLENVEASILMDGQPLVSNQKTNSNGLIETSFKKHYKATSDVITYISNYNKLNPEHQNQYKNYPKSYDEAMTIALNQANERLESQISSATYTFQAIENKPRQGYYYDLSNTSKVITTKDNNVVFTFENNIQTCDIRLLKLDDDTKLPIPNVTFGLYAASDIFHPDGKTGLLYKKDELVDTFMKTDENGETSLSDLYIGSYYLKELEKPAHLISNLDPIYIEIPEHDKQNISVSKTLYNNTSKVSIHKIDHSTNKPLSDATLELYDSQNQLIETWITENKPHTIIGLNVGETYTLVETKAPLGFSLSKPMTFKVEDTSDIQEIILENNIIEGLVVFNKTGDVFKHFKEGQAVYKTEPLEGSELTIYAAKDIILGNGVCLYKKDDIVVTLNSNTSTTLPYGSYYAYETKVPEGYLQDEKYYAFEINGKKDIILDLKNNLPKFTLDFTKELEGSHDFSDVSFGIYTREDELITICKVDEFGHLIDVPRLPYGNYYLKEETTHPLYVLDETKYPFEITYQDKDTKTYTIPINEGKPIINQLKRASLTLYKTNEQDTPLQGASFTLYNQDKEVLETQVTNKDGMIVFENLIYGQYYIQETKAPEGYLLNEEWIKIDLNKDIEMKQSNTLIPEIIEEEPEKPIEQQTGDQNAIPLFIVMFTLSSSALFFGVKKKGRSLF